MNIVVKNSMRNELQSLKKLDKPNELDGYAEMKLRTCLKNRTWDEGDNTENGAKEDDDVNDVRQQHKQQNNQQLQLQCIGTRVHSPWYGRGYIQLNIPVECVEG